MNGGGKATLAPQQKRRRRVWLLLIPGLLIASLPVLQWEAFDQWKLTLLFGASSAWVLNRPEQVTIYRLDHRYEQITDEAIDLLKEGRDPRKPGTSWRTRFHSALAAPGLLGFIDEKPARGPRAGVAARLQRGGRTVEVLVCFGCSEVSVAPPGSLNWRGFPVKKLHGLALELYPDFHPLHD